MNDCNDYKGPCQQHRQQTSNRNNDRFGEETVAVPNVDAKTAIAIMDSWVAKHGIPKVILSDQGKDYQTLCAFISILDAKRQSSSYMHKQTEQLKDGIEHQVQH